ncbi:hypothetical protein C8F01DRAFT_1266483 [Mycena amicta]|nr:hypothetical protein C8F01DRAFT_1266483 [Mycena amicta]
MHTTTALLADPRTLCGLCPAQVATYHGSHPSRWRLGTLVWYTSAVPYLVNALHDFVTVLLAVCPPFVAIGDDVRYGPARTFSASASSGQTFSLLAFRSGPGTNAPHFLLDIHRHGTAARLVVGSLHPIHEALSIRLSPTFRMESAVTREVSFSVTLPLGVDVPSTYRFEPVSVDLPTARPCVSSLVLVPLGIDVSMRSRIGSSSAFANGSRTVLERRTVLASLWVARRQSNLHRSPQHRLPRHRLLDRQSLCVAHTTYCFRRGSGLERYFIDTYVFSSNLYRRAVALNAHYSV